jgi:very-short-patch-repair endonuclease
MLPYGKNLKHLARDLRKGQTDAEQRLGSPIRRKQLADVPFYRQKPLGPYLLSREMSKFQSNGNYGN